MKYFQTTKVRTGKEIIDNPAPADVVWCKETKSSYIYADKKWLAADVAVSPLTGTVCLIDSFDNPGDNLEFDPDELMYNAAQTTKQDETK